MFDNDDLDNNYYERELKMRELAIRMENIDRESNELLEELKVSPAQLSAFLDQKENFTEENWAFVREKRTLLDTKLKCELENVRNPIKTKRALSSLHVKRHWLHVR